MYAIFKREFLSYFRSPVGYIAIALFSFLAGFQFIDLFSQGSGNIAGEIISLRSYFVVIVPIITMGLFAEDRKRGTEVLFYTSPIDIGNVVFGKFLSAFLLYVIMFFNVIIHIIVVKVCGGDIGVEAIGALIVFFFLAALFISIGIFASAITDSQIISAIVSFIMILGIQMISSISELLSEVTSSVLQAVGVPPYNANTVANGVSSILNWFDPFAKTDNFIYGIFSVMPLFFCVSLALVFLYLTFRILEKKRWSQK